MLTDEQIERISQATFRRVQDMPDDKVNGGTWDREFARAIEAHVRAESRPVPAGRRECIRLGLAGDCRKGKLCPGCDGMPAAGTKDGGNG